MIAKFSSRCRYCGNPVTAGVDDISKRSNGWGHTKCPSEANETESFIDKANGEQKALLASLEAVEPRVIGQDVADQRSDSTASIQIDRVNPFNDSEPEDEQPAKVFAPSRYQEAIYEFMKSGEGNGAVLAGPGSGKSTTLKHCGPFIPASMSVAAIAFNKKNALDLQKMMPAHFRSSTFHSLCYKQVRARYPEIKEPDDRKSWSILNELKRQIPAMYKVIEEEGAAINRLVSLAKNTLTNDYEYLASRFNVQMDNPQAVIELASIVFTRSVENITSVDFDDMLYLHATGVVPTETFDFLLVDEMQDLNAAQLASALRYLAPGGRMLCVGDRKQSIYGFRGADVDAVDKLIAATSATTLPLSITYRMPLSHVERLNAKFPDAKVEARPNAPDGVIGNLTEGQMIAKLQSGDMVICRMNAPLVGPCFELIRQGRKATIAGRDIGKGLVSLLDKMIKRIGSQDVSWLMRALMEYRYAEYGKLLSAGKEAQAASLQDSIDTLIALSDGCSSANMIERKIASVFSDEVQGVVFSSVHKAKGLEADNVYIFRPELIPHPMAKQEWEKKSETNLQYVAESRSKNAMYFVEGE